MGRAWTSLMLWYANPHIRTHRLVSLLETRGRTTLGGPRDPRHPGLLGSGPWASWLQYRDALEPLSGLPVAFWDSLAASHWRTVPQPTNMS